MTEPLRDVRFWSKVDIQPGDACWLWTASKVRGYGRFRLNGLMHPAHRVAYEMVVGPIPHGLTLDHLCRTLSCVRPSHLEPVSGRENILRGEGPAARAARRTECPQGHSYSAENTRLFNDKRYCRTCQNAGRRRRHRAARQIEVASWT